MAPNNILFAREHLGDSNYSSQKLFEEDKVDATHIKEHPNHSPLYSWR